MTISIFDLLRVGIGPSSSHTVGPMRAARRFVTEQLGSPEALARTETVQVDLYGSLSATGRGHGTFTAVLLGLEGWDPETILPEQVDSRLAAMEASGMVQLGARREHDGAESGSAGGQPAQDPAQEAGRETRLRVEDFIQRPLTVMDRHTNAMTLTAFDAEGGQVAKEIFYSIGGGFVLSESDAVASDASLGEALATPDAEVPYPFTTAAQLMEHCARSGLPVSRVMLANERALHRARHGGTAEAAETEITSKVLHLWQVMEECKNSALEREGHLPGGLKVRRRAPDWHARMWKDDPGRTHAYWQEWVNLVALAVNEENASGGRVVTAPTNGAAGIIPAVGFYATHYGPGASYAGEEDREDIAVRFLLTAAAIGVLYKEQASISGAEVGCQGEVGSAASMAAAGLCEVLGGSAKQVENAAEIAMEHNLGLTCDPIGGLVQVPCIERNAMGATKAVNAARMALMGDGDHRVSLDEVIVTMRETGKDMSSKYKETALGGLAVNVVEC
ncbi:L-serine ammonia-lyase [Nesterenkonia aurantiaca]|uniref:L-serine dehydratase n=1 Tax=Nesterenkonia aurantiaca TaxID=1436010 RepID=A0A4R7FYB1_9MICC|nr:L-serine ammonia-lyase [Nesterenkonia aurantiaca]TDS83791.1 L-serine dehydratase [Nesterenkonia aurantiaca]